MVGPKRIRMHFLYSKVEREKSLKTLGKNIKSNQGPTQLESYANKVT